MRGVVTEVEPMVRQIQKLRTELKHVHRFIQHRNGHPPYEDAQRIAITAGIRTWPEYRINYKRLKLPACPDQVYRGFWCGIKQFLGTGTRRNNWPSYLDARKIVQDAGIKTVDQYKKKRRDLGLPCIHTYLNRHSRITSYEFFGTCRPIWPRFLQAQKRVRAAHIKSISEYKKRHRSLVLPACPDKVYREMWDGWDHFFRIQRPVPYYKVRNIVRFMGITTKAAYIRRGKKLNLPSICSLEKYYAYKGWRQFCQINRRTRSAFTWPSYREAKRRVRRAGIKSVKQYRASCRALGLPGSPRHTYAKQWHGFELFAGSPFCSFSEARKRVRRLGISMKEEYLKRYKEVPGLPSNPCYFYPSQWKGFQFFLGIGKPLPKSLWSTKSGCRVCHHPLRKQIDGNLSIGISPAIVKLKYRPSPSRAALYRHKQHI